MTTSDSLGLAREFLDLWADIERYLRHKDTLSDRARGMDEVLDALRDRDSLVRRYYPALSAFRKLRNAISHDRYRDGDPIATPRVETVDSLRRIHGELLNPVRIGQCLRSQEVITATPDEPLRDALRKMAQHTYSQLPVYENGRYLFLLTTNAVARWLAAQINDAGEILIDRVHVREVLEYVEPTENVIHRARTVTVASIIDEFRRGVDANSLVAVIVTENGQPTQSALGVVVRDDLAYLLGRLPDVVA